MPEPLSESVRAAVGRLLKQVSGQEIVPRFRHLAAGEVREKNPGDYVTIADEAAETALTAALKGLVPESVVVGEEAVAGDGEVLDRLNGEAPVWVVDPLDGTRFFAHGQTGFTVMVAYVRAGTTQAGWIYDPVNDRLAEGYLGEGACLDGQPVRVPAPETLGELAGHFSLPLAEPGEKRAIRQRLKAHLKQDLRGMPAGLSYLGLLTGRHHVSFFQKLAPWDHAAGALLHGEAGGCNGVLGGGVYGPTYRGQGRHDGLLLAPTSHHWHKVRRRILNGADDD